MGEGVGSGPPLKENTVVLHTKYQGSGPYGFRQVDIFISLHVFSEAS